jgi:ribose 1,5-bisphosphokinase
LNQTATLFYLVGPSGVGKDSLLHALRNCPGADRLRVARRYITRPARRGDDHHVELEPAEFERRERNGDFLFAWRSHGFSYAVETGLLACLDADEDLLVNGSRAYLETAREIVPGLVPVWMQVPEAVLRDRLARRARESAAEIERRLERNRHLERGRCVEWPVIVNDGSIEQTCRRFLAIRAHYRLAEPGKAK